MSLNHAGLRASLSGIEDKTYSSSVLHFRGIKYASISGRFKKPEAIEDLGGKHVDCSSFGPQCPQLEVDIGHLLRLPEEYVVTQIAEDEFECLNLNVTIPKTEKKNMPVILWIHGGSQTVTFPSASSACGDPTRIVAQSMQMDTPVVFVTFNYRLNIFAFGDGTGEKNLALQDQRLAIAWVQKNISGFGGDPNQITIAGESAGAVYAHAHLSTDSSLKSGILASGSLYLSPPLPPSFGEAMIQRLAASVRKTEGKSLASASVASLLDALKENNVVSMWLQEEESLLGWQDRTKSMANLMIGDVEYESVIWRNGVETSDPADISAAFEMDASHGQQLRKLYGVVKDRPTACRNGALDFIADARFGLPVEEIWKANHAESAKATKCYRFLVDEPNPWHPSSRAHHGVDLVLLFGGYDFSKINPHAERVGETLRRAWVDFANGKAPWPAAERFAFGPLGKCTSVTEEEFAGRRRTRAYDLLREMGWARYNPTFGKLAAGKISLNN